MIHTDGKRTIANAPASCKPRIVKSAGAKKQAPRDPVAGVLATAERIVREEAERLGWLA